LFDATIRPECTAYGLLNHAQAKSYRGIVWWRHSSNQTVQSRVVNETCDAETETIPRRSKNAPRPFNVSVLVGVEFKI